MKQRKDFVRMLKADAERKDENLPRLYPNWVRSGGHDLIYLEFLTPEAKLEFRRDEVNRMAGAFYNLTPHRVQPLTMRPHYSVWMTLIVRPTGLYITKINEDQTVNVLVCDRHFEGELLPLVTKAAIEYLDLDAIRKDPEYLKALRYIELAFDKIFAKNVLSPDLHTLSIPNKGEELYEEWQDAWKDIPDGED
jgi:hypothetical protein